MFGFISGGPAYPGTRGSVTTFNLKVDSLLQPWAQEKMRKNWLCLGLGGWRPHNQNRKREYDESDNPLFTKCAPIGLMKAYTFGGPFQIVYASKKRDINVLAVARLDATYLDGWPKAYPGSATVDGGVNRPLGGKYSRY